jgi:hypothetical protein
MPRPFPPPDSARRQAGRAPGPRPPRRLRAGRQGRARSQLVAAVHAALGVHRVAEVAQQVPEGSSTEAGAWHAACGTSAHGRAACWSEHRRIGQLARSSTHRRQIALIWTTAQSMPTGPAPAPNGSFWVFPRAERMARPQPGRRARRSVRATGGGHRTLRNAEPTLGAVRVTVHLGSASSDQLILIAPHTAQRTSFMGSEGRGSLRRTAFRRRSAWTSRPA